MQTKTNTKTKTKTTKTDTQTPQAAKMPPVPVPDTVTPTQQLTEQQFFKLADIDPIKAAATLDPAATTREIEELNQISPFYRSKVVKLLYFLMRGDPIVTVLQKVSISNICLSHALNCHFFAKTYQNLRKARQFRVVEEIEAAQSALAAGRAAKDPDHLPPDPTAAKLILQAHDPLYHAGATAPITAINIQVNGLPI